MKMSYCFCSLLFFLLFLPDLFELHELREGWAAWTDVEGGQFVKHKNIFLKFRNHGRRFSRAETFGRGSSVSSHGIRPFSVYLSLLAPDVNHDAGFFRLVRRRGAHPGAHPGVSLPAGVKCSPFRFSFFVPCLCSRRRISSNTVLTRLSGLPTLRWRSRRGLRLGEGEREQRGGVRDEGSPLRQFDRSHFTFCHETKVPSDYKPKSRAWVLINIGRTLFMFPLTGYFLHVSLAPQVLMGRRVQREDESCATPGFNPRWSACLACAWKSVCAHTCTHPTGRVHLRAVLYEGGKGSSNPDPTRPGSESIFGLFVLGMTA